MVGGYPGSTAGMLLRALIRWPLGVALTSWRYMWRTTPLHRSEVVGRLPDDAPPPLSSGPGVQDPPRGEGRLFHRVYRAAIRGARLEPAELIAAMTADLNRVAPTEFARFRKVSGASGAMAVGDEYVVRMPGPWDGPVRVVARTPSSFRFVTLEGHLEAGQIEFSARHAGGLLEFRIESWARSGDRLSELLYERLRMSKEIQLHMWTSVLERVSRLAGGKLAGGIEIRTRRVAGRRELNFDGVPDGGWNVDALEQALPAGSGDVARELISSYRVADPAIVRASFDPEAPLMGREMELQLRLYRLLRVTVGVRVGRVWDSVRDEDGRPVRVFGYEYGTLQGHVEMGRMSYEVWEWLDDGAAEFRLRAHSRASGDGPWWARVGFRLFGRREQVRFYFRCCERMARLCAAELGLPDSPQPPAVRLREAGTPETGRLASRLVP